LYTFFISPIRAACSPYLITLIWSTWWSLQVMKLLIMQSSPASRHFLPLRSKYSPWHSVLKHPQSCSSISVRDQVSYPHKITGKITVLYILIFMSL
jgi:hypothetical protein